MNRQFRMPGLVHFDRIESEADQQIRGGQRLAHETVGGHPADDADEVAGRFVDNPFHLRRHGNRQIPVSHPSPDALRMRRINAQSDQHQRPAGLKACATFDAAASFTASRADSVR